MIKPHQAGHLRSEMCMHIIWVLIFITEIPIVLKSLAFDCGSLSSSLGKLWLRLTSLFAGYSAIVMVVWGIIGYHDYDGSWTFFVSWHLGWISMASYIVTTIICTWNSGTEKDSVGISDNSEPDKILHFMTVIR